MGLIDALTRLDAKVLPRLARGLARITRAARRTRIRPLPAAATLLVLAVLATIVWRLGEPGADPGTGPYIRVGVSEGVLIEDYVAGGRVELQRLAAGPDAADPVFALVSFSTYLDAAQVAALVAAAGPQLVTVSAYARVPLPRRQTEIIRLGAQQLPQDLLSSMAGAAERKAADAAEYAAKARAAETDELRHTFESNAEIDAAEAAAFSDPACACVFAMVVKGAPAVLSRLGAQPGVRVVDPAPELTTITASTTFSAPLPEQTGRVAPPPDDGLDPGPDPTPYRSEGG